MILGLLGSRAALYAGVAVAALVVGGIVLHRHDNAVRAEMQAAQDKVIAAATVENQRRVNDALNAMQAAQSARDAALAATRRTINAAPLSAACSGSAPVRAALDGLRTARRPGPAPAHP